MCACIKCDSTSFEKGFFFSQKSKAKFHSWYKAILNRNIVFFFFARLVANEFIAVYVHKTTKQTLNAVHMLENGLNFLNARVICRSPFFFCCCCSYWWWCLACDCCAILGMHSNGFSTRIFFLLSTETTMDDVEE